MIKVREGLISLIKKGIKIIKATLGIQAWLITIRNFPLKILLCLKNLNSLNKILWGVRHLDQNH